MKKWMSYAVVILWLAAAAKYIVGGEATGAARVTRAFTEADFQGTECSLCLAGYLDGADYDRERKLELLRELAGELGMYTQYTIQESEQDNLDITEISKEMPKARASIRLVTMENGAANEIQQANYLYFNLHFYQSSDSGLYYKEKLEQVAEKYGLEASVTMMLTGAYEGVLDLEARDAVSGQLLEAMGAQEQESCRESELYTIYAYTESWNEYTVVNGKRVNINLAFSYDEIRDKTYVHLGSPLILTEY